MRQVLSGSVCALAIGFFGLVGAAPPAWAATTAPIQKAIPPMKLEMKRDTGLSLGPGCAEPDKVQATDLTLSPAQPRAGQAVTVALTIKNLCTTGNLNIPWRIETGTGGSANDVLGSGTQQNVAPGATFTVTAPWTAVAGQRGFLGTADPQNTLHENNQNRANNLKDLALAVPQASAQKAGDGGSPPRLVTQVLDYQKAKAAGARFANSVEGFAPCYILGQFDAKNYGGADKTAVFEASCPGPGGRATPEAFTDFQLKNGWKIKTVETSERTRSGGSDWQWVDRPREGNQTPRMKMHVWANPGSEISVWVKVVIEGPDGTDPYAASR